MAAEVNISCDLFKKSFFIADVSNMFENSQDEPIIINKVI